MDCYDCKAKSVCAAVVQRGSVICLMNRMRYCGTHAEEEPRRQQGDYCQYCGHRLREIGRERFCNNVNCRNRYVNVWGVVSWDVRSIPRMWKWQPEEYRRWSDGKGLL